MVALYCSAATTSKEKSDSFSKSSAQPKKSRYMLCMKTLAIPFLLIASTPAATEAQVGQPAIDSLPDLDSTATKLSDFRGKTVVLEWFNPGCPFVVYAHESGPLKSFAAEANKDDVVWLAINSSAPESKGTVSSSINNLQPLGL